MFRLGSEVSIESVEAPGSQGASRAKYRAYSTEAQRSEAGCIGARMQHDFRDGTLARALLEDDVAVQTVVAIEDRNRLERERLDE